MAVRSGTGFDVAPGSAAAHAWLFGESPSLVVLCAAPERAAEVQGACDGAGVACHEIGRAGGSRLRVGDLVDVTVDEAVSAWRDDLPEAMAAGATH
jgi:phosphoribosylformylglycinamidine synthase